MGAGWPFGRCCLVGSTDSCHQSAYDRKRSGFGPPRPPPRALSTREANNQNYSPPSGDNARTTSTSQAWAATAWLGVAASVEAQPDLGGMSRGGVAGKSGRGGWLTTEFFLWFGPPSTSASTQRIQLAGRIQEQGEGGMDEWIHRCSCSSSASIKWWARGWRQDYSLRNSIHARPTTIASYCSCQLADIALLC